MNGFCVVRRFERQRKDQANDTRARYTCGHGTAWGNRMRRLLSVVVLAGSLFGRTPGHAFAQQGSKPVGTQGVVNAAAVADSDRAAYESALQKGLTEFNLGHWAEAKVFFLHAHALQPSARTLRSLGLTSYEMRLYVEALAYLTQALASRERPLTAKMRSETLTQIEECKSFISYETISIEPNHASLQVDGQAATPDAHGTLLLDPGEHQLRADAAGYEPWIQVVTARSGEHRTLAITLSNPSQPAPVAASTATHDVFGTPTGDRPPASDDHGPVSEGSFWSTRSTPQIVGVALAAGGVLALGVGTAFSIAAANENAASKRTCMGDSCDPEGLAHRNSALSRADVATASFIATGVLVATGAVLYFAVPTAERGPRALRVIPAIGPDQAALCLAGALW